MKIIFLLLPLLLFSKEITLEFLEDKPKSIAKDFYIWRFLKQDITSKEADIAYNQAKRKSYKIVKEYKKKTKNRKFMAEQDCYALKGKALLKAEYSCLVKALSISKALKTNHNILKEVAKKVEGRNKTLAQSYRILASKYPIREILNSDPKYFLYIFSRLPSSFVRKHFNLYYQKDFLNKLANEKKFEKFIRTVVFGDTFTNSRKTLFNIKSKNASHNSNFFLAMNAIRANKTKEAKVYLEYARDKAKKRFEKDKSLYWLYLVSKDEKYLSKIVDNSFDVNIYSLLAYEKFNRWPSNIITSVATSDKERIFNESNPFEWIKILEDYKKSKDIKKAIKSLNYKNTENLLSYIMERHNNYQFEYFIFPYTKYFKNKSLDRQALLLSLARQESRFIPSAISTSYALGVMQVMPFLANHIAKQLKMKNFDLDDALKPDINIKFADYHLDHDLRKLKHPLLIAYAYNGGVGFTRKMLKKGLFNTKNKFEPFFSMELVPYSESRKYGKKVLANYVVYKRLLGEKIKTSSILQSVISHSQNLYAKK